MPEEKKEEEQKTSEVKETSDGGVEVALKEEEKKDAEVLGEEKAEEKKPVKEQDPFKNKVYAQDRIIAKLQKEMEDLRQEKTTLASKQTQEQEADLDDLDKLAQKDWKAAVRKLAQDEAKRIQQEEKKNLEATQSKIMINQRLEQNTQSVLSRHPELDDAASEKYQVFQGILDKHPDWRLSPDGPLLTMYEMENELRAKGYDIDGSIKKKVEQEQERLLRVNASSVGSGRPTASGNKVVLTKDQRDFCDQNGISYEQYARTLTKSGDRMGVEI